ncbi:MAG: class I SAM-dependent methyltransferase [Verrucomicrobiota bacterium]|nr:class I SAM-dependent methyltransferase [Verrucomicrobiota bacterium]
MKSIVRRFRLKGIWESFLQRLARMSARWASRTHKWLMDCQWGIPPQPEHFDHQIDLFYQWLSTRNSLWTERGCFGALALKGQRVLELACGDGFNARNFYSLRSVEIIACDFDPLAIQTARTKNSAPNVTFILADIRTHMPTGTFDNVIWDAAIEHFTENEIAALMQDIKARLTDAGVLSGYTIVEREGGKHLTHHEYEFKNKEDLLRFFTPHFKFVRVFETIYPSRHNLYFWASDELASVPFSSEWCHATQNRL